MNNTGKRVDVVRAYHNHPEEWYRQNGVPVLGKVVMGSSEFAVMGKDIVSYTPTCDACPDPETPTEDETAPSPCVADGGECIYRYDERGDQVCQTCGNLRNQAPPISRHPQESGRYTGFQTDDS